MGGAIRYEQGGDPTGQTVITTDGKLIAGYIIHTADPIWKNRTS